MLCRGNYYQMQPVKLDQIWLSIGLKHLIAVRNLRPIAAGRVSENIWLVNGNLKKHDYAIYSRFEQSDRFGVPLIMIKDRMIKYKENI